MAGLAGDVDRGVRGGEAPGLRVVVLAHAGGVALRAHVVPVLAGTRPVQLVGMGHVLARVQVEPALPALRARPRVPGDGERLQAPARQLQQVLLELRGAERVLDLVVGESAVGAVGAHHELAVASGEGRRDSGVGEARIVEVAGHRRLGRRLHGQIVMGAAPALLDLGVALAADLMPDVGRDHRSGRRSAGQPPRPRAHRLPPPEAGRRDDEDREAHRDGQSATATRTRIRGGVCSAARRGGRLRGCSGGLPALLLLPTHSAPDRGVRTRCRRCR